jgi:hypothetical protein
LDEEEEERAAHSAAWRDSARVKRVETSEWERGARGVEDLRAGVSVYQAEATIVVGRDGGRAFV